MDLIEVARWEVSERGLPARAGGPIALGTDLRLYLASLDGARIVAFDPADGSHRFLGDAPAWSPERVPELENVMRLGFRADSLWVVDRRAQRIVVFDPGFAPARAIEPVAGTGAPQALLESGSILSSSALGAASTGAGQAAPQQLQTYLPETRAVRTLTTLEIGNGTLVVATDRGLVAMNYQPFRDYPLWDVDPAYREVVIVDRTAAREAPGEILIRRYPVDGGEPVRIIVPYDPLPISDEEAREALRVASERLATYFDNQAALGEAVRNGLYLPPNRPPVSGMLLGDDANVWLQREADDSGWQIVDGEGGITGRVSVPPAVRLRLVRGDRAWGFDLSEPGVPFLVEFRLRRASRGEEYDGHPSGW